jgi:PBP1b-binding outer membrane lipoprotein LpoB
MRATQRGPDPAMPETFNLASWQMNHAAVRCAFAATIAAVLLAGCTQSSVPEPLQAAQAAVRQTDAPICRPEPALLAPQSAPDCIFRRGDLKTIDPDQWARLKIEYERQCYQNAERTVRDRLNRLSAANRCEG